jgi:thiamine pyrophosphate-dependent acetolactate synthase large subunit-like protein
MTPIGEGFDCLAAPLKNEGCVASWAPTEQPAAFKAATYGRLRGKPGVCISALGPGVLSFCFISKALL